MNVSITFSITKVYLGQQGYHFIEHSSFTISCFCKINNLFNKNKKGLPWTLFDLKRWKQKYAFSNYVICIHLPWLPMFWFRNYTMPCTMSYRCLYNLSIIRLQIKLDECQSQMRETQCMRVTKRENWEVNAAVFGQSENQHLNI
jgi:hypothetical protein